MKQLQVIKIMGMYLIVMRETKNKWLNITTFLSTNAG